MVLDPNKNVMENLVNIAQGWQRMMMMMINLSIKNEISHTYKISMIL
jgi:hypothetical protein